MNLTLLKSSTSLLTALLLLFVGQAIAPSQTWAVDLSGTIVFQDCDGPATPVSGVTVFLSEGSSTITNGQGEFEFTGIPRGDYELTFDGDALRVDPVPVRLGSSDLTGLTIPAFEEVVPPLANPTYTLWNGFLGLTNILELVNRGDSSLSGIVELYDISGQLVSTTPFQVSPFGEPTPGIAEGQLDIVVNTIPGFQADTYGILKIIYTGDLDGRLTYYNGPDFQSDLDFVFGLPFSTPIAGKSSVSFNTNRPSIAPNVIFNWLSIVNLDLSAQTYQVDRYDFFGNLLSSGDIVVPPFGRVDLDGGHVNPGPDQIGLINITPQNDSAPYLALLIRYGARDSLGINFDFAFPLVAKTPSPGTLFAPVSSRFGGTSFLELVNTDSQPVTINYSVFNQSGQSVFSQARTLAPFSQHHEFVTPLLPEESIGLAEIQSSRPGVVIAQAMNYFSRPQDGRMKAIYGSQAREALGPRQLGSYNRFIGMNNWLRVFNTSNSEVGMTNSTDNTGAFGVPTPRILAPRAGTEFALHDSSTNNTVPNTYGLTEVTSSCSSFFIAEVIRQRNELSGDLDFALPTEVR